MNQLSYLNLPASERARLDACRSMQDAANNDYAASGYQNANSPDTLTTAQLSALLEGWTPTVTGQDNSRELLLCAVKNRIALGRLSADDLVRVKAA